MTPLMICFSGIMVILEALDNGTSQYLMVTPLGRKGYLLSRIGVSLILSIGYNMFLLYCFRLSEHQYGFFIPYILISGGWFILLARKLKRRLFT